MFTETSPGILAPKRVLSNVVWVAMMRSFAEDLRRPASN
jgi:hypothetical protein